MKNPTRSFPKISFNIYGNSNKHRRPSGKAEDRIYHMATGTGTLVHSLGSMNLSPMISSMAEML